MCMEYGMKTMPENTRLLASNFTMRGINQNIAIVIRVPTGCTQGTSPPVR